MQAPMLVLSLVLDRSLDLLQRYLSNFCTRARDYLVL